MAPKLVTEALRDAIVASGRSIYELGNRTDVQHASLSRFLRRMNQLRGDKIDALAAELGYELRPVAGKAKGTADTGRKRAGRSGAKI